MIAPLLPPALKKGDTVAIVAPAGQLSSARLFNQGVEILQQMGFRVVFPGKLWPGETYLADSDRNRGSEFNTLLCNPDIQGLISLRGGFGCLRMIDRIDLKQIQKTPKIIAGFSDITILQNFLIHRTGLVAMHGPVLTSLATSTDSALKRYFQCLSGNWLAEIDTSGIEVLQISGTATAPLIGGNLASLVTLLGTPYDFKWDGKIVVLEDTNEPLYRIDRMLTQLSLAGKFTRLSGLILGDFSCSSIISELEKRRYIESIWDIVTGICKQKDFPIWGNFPIGHCPENLTLPLGSFAKMDSENKRLLFF